jgi:23S rRNA pseudouridine2605 synthase
MPTQTRDNQTPAARRTSASAGPQRLQKVLASAGVGSRRHCEELIAAGRVEVDKQVVTELGSKADPARQEIRVDGELLRLDRHVYFVVNKPTGVVCTNSDPSGRMRVTDLVAYDGRLFTVGRLDMSSEGLILVTNDGELANRLAHPRYGIEKTYYVEVAGVIESPQLERLRKGVHLAEGFARVVSVKVKHQYKNSTLLEIVLNEGRNRELRRILARVGHKVERLKRVALGPLRLGELPPGHVRQLERGELRTLKQAAYGKPASRPRTRPRRASKPALAARPSRVVIGGERSNAKTPGPRKAGGARTVARTTIAGGKQPKRRPRP